MPAAAGRGMGALIDPTGGREATSQALIDLVADVAWAERRRAGEAGLQRMRDEAIALLPRVQAGDREATRRAQELVSAASVALA